MSAAGLGVLFDFKLGLLDGIEIDFYRGIGFMVGC